MKNDNHRITFAEIIISAMLSFIDKVNDIFDKILESKIGFLLIALSLITISVVIIIQVNKG
jgi:TRAP-type C4-dicarboxylate transport system permease small subunit